MWLGPLIRHEEFMIYASVVSLFIDIEDESREQFVVGNNTAPRQ
jgi:hypothetical protein